MADLLEIRDALAVAAPKLTSILADLAVQWTESALRRLDSPQDDYRFPKVFNDPVWGTIELLPWETILLDSPLLQRLRGVRQLGMAHHVYMGATHDRLAHTVGVVETTDRMMAALARNAENRRMFARDIDADIPLPSDLDKTASRLAALLHDIGHGPFSHATERLLRSRLPAEFEAAENCLRAHFDGTTKIATAETVAVLLVLSDAMKKIFEHPSFGAKIGSDPASNIAPSVAARILGSRSYLRATYFSGLISGPLDADKLDYMTRDSHHAGLPIGIDVNRLISKLEVVTITPDNVPASLPELRKRARESASGRIYEMGISSAGIGAYEQMLINRVILYDRIYFHHKVRTAEAMVRQLINVAEHERERLFSIPELLTNASDEEMIGIVSGELKSARFDGGGERSLYLGRAIKERRLYRRAYAFAARFIRLTGLSEEQKKETRTVLWDRLSGDLASANACESLAKAIWAKAAELATAIPALSHKANDFRREHVLVDISATDKVVRPADTLMRTHGGYVSMPNLFFDPNRWAQAYEHQKLCGFVFAPREYRLVVSLAARIVFCDRFDVVATVDADRVCKLADMIEPAWFDEAADGGLCSRECAEALRSKRVQLIRFRDEDLHVPAGWRDSDPNLGTRLAREINELLPGGLPAATFHAVVDAIAHLCSFIKVVEEGGMFVKKIELSEAALQIALRDHLRSSGLEVQEGSEVGGGETDLVLPGSIVVENKIRGETADPFESGPHYVWQARRYSIAICKNICIIVLGYKPANEGVVLSQEQRIQVSKADESPEGFVQIRFVVPYGHGTPVTATRPSGNDG